MPTRAATATALDAMHDAGVNLGAVMDMPQVLPEWDTRVRFDCPLPASMTENPDEPPSTNATNCPSGETDGCAKEDDDS